MQILGHAASAPEIFATRHGRRSVCRGVEREGGNLSEPSGPGCRRLSARTIGRHQRASSCPMAVGPARPAFCRRQSAGREQHGRHRSRRARAARRLHAALDQHQQLHQCDAVREAAVQFHPRHRAGRRQYPRAAGHGSESGVPVNSVPEFIAYCQSQSRQDQHGVGRHRQFDAYGRRTVQDDDRRRHDRMCPIAVRRRRSPISSPVASR